MTKSAPPPNRFTRWLNRTLDSTAPVYLTAVLSVAIAVVFIFVRAPHPWGWEGFDHYHDLGLALARGAPFPTTDRPWGYAYFLAPFYRLFGDRPWIPLLAQALVNGLVPILLYGLVSLEFDRRTAVAAAMLTGVLSFNTVYASTQSADALCTVILVAALLAFAEARARSGLPWFALAGALFSLASQFRPNLLMLPAVLAALHLASRPRTARKLAETVVLLAAAALVIAPWTIRNYRLMGLWLPTSTRGGAQLWYATLQTGRHRENRVYNPRSNFEFSSFDYSSVAGRPLVVSVEIAPCADRNPASIELTYWTDRQRGPVQLAPRRQNGDAYIWDVPGQPIPTVLYYFVDARWLTEQGALPQVARLPRLGARGPAIHFINDQHLRDLDIHGDLLDVFDVIRMARAVAWGEAIGNANQLDFDGDGRITERDIQRAGDILIRSRPGPVTAAATVTGVRQDEARAVVTFADGSTLTVPRQSTGLLSDIVADGDYAGRLVRAAVRFSVLASGSSIASANPAVCDPLRHLAVNKAFYLAEPDAMRRYTALAWDNIRADPAAYLASCAYRALRLFVVQGSDDPQTAYQFPGSRFVYSAATIASLLYLALFLAGVAVAVRQQRPLLVLGVPILYVPATIIWVQTNMRYTVTVQPLVFAFIALAVLAAVDRAGSRTAHRP